MSTSGGSGGGSGAVSSVFTRTGAVVAATNDYTPAQVGALALTGGSLSGALAMGSNKITGLANGSAATDAAAYGQIPAAGPTLTVITYTPGGAYTLTSAAPVAVDTTNLTISFTTGATGSVLCFINLFANNYDSQYPNLEVGYFTHGTNTTVAGLWYIGQSGYTPSSQFCVMGLVTGLTANTAYHWDLMAAQSAGASHHISIAAGSPVVLTMFCF